MGCAAQQSGGVASVRERQVGVVVQGFDDCGSAEFRHAEFGGPPLPPKGSYGEGNAEGNSVDAGGSKE